MAEAEAKAKVTPPPTVVSPDTVFVKNPTGVIHDMSEDDPRTEATIELAKKAHNGWSLASDQEIADYCALNNLVPAEPEKKGPGRPAKAE